MKFSIPFISSVLCVLGTPLLWAGPRVLPILNASLTGGAASIDGKKTDFEGSVKAEILPVVELNEQHALLPTLRGSYAGTQKAVTILDEQTLFQQEQDYQAELGWLYRFAPSWKLITTGGGTWTYLRDTSDESWAQGLYNHQSAYGNLTIEKRWSQTQRPVTLRMGGEISQMLFPNYESLSSQSGNALIGQRLLDSDGSQFFLEMESSLAHRLRGKGRLSFGLDQYRDQQVIDLNGNPSGGSRKDSVFLATAHIDRGFASWRVGGQTIEPTVRLGLRGSGRISNQNEFDQGRFIEDYYSYREAGLSAATEFFFRPTGWVLSLGLDGAGRVYPHRPAQESDGTLRSSDLFTTTTAGSFRCSFPLWNKFNGIVGTDRVWASSNTDYEAIYNYQYTSFSYYAGVSYAY